ncbi:MAG: hypothetical protein ABSE86_26870 [Bryobacteraceae bacterium]|jgi:hypothetical protein
MNLADTATRAGATLSHAQDRVMDFGLAAGEKLDEARKGTADALENAAFSVRTNGREGAQTIEDISEKAAGKLDATAQYVRSHDVGGMLGNLRQVIGRNPTGFLILAAGVGFLAGSAFRSNNSEKEA